jgi:hypothetical protein
MTTHSFSDFLRVYHNYSSEIREKISYFEKKLGRSGSACPIAFCVNFHIAQHYNQRRAEALKTVGITTVGVNLTAIEARVLRLSAGRFAPAGSNGNNGEMVGVNLE